ncbi:hypothetical protein ABLE93_07185 [Xanthobacter sp. KR7-65]|uniref:hypothetical protein n=1 Tax=Xanthobacter sp. KR7-65 TaxID=3156612 RepID=UPI0032B50B57
MSTRSAVLRRAALLPVLVLAVVPARAEGEAKRTLNADGTVSMTYATPVDEYGAVIGIDLSKAAGSVAPSVVQGAGDLGGTAYAKVTLAHLPDWMVWEKGAVNISVDPNDAHSKVATTFSRDIPLSGALAATLADSYQIANGSEAWATDKSLSLKLNETGTTFAIATRATSDTQQFLPSVSARQQLAGNLSVTAAIADTGSTLNRSITAGFTHRW